MTETQIGELLLYLAFFFALSYLLAGILEKIRIPGILGALFIAMAAHYTPMGKHLLSGKIYEPFSFLAQLGVLFLLFFIGLQIDLKEMRGLRRDILSLTVLNTTVPFIFGMAVMLGLGYGWLMAFVIGLTRMPTAEAVIVPILDEFQLIRTRVGEFIIGAGVLDDVIEVFLVAFVSVWIGEKAGQESGEIVRILIGLFMFICLALVSSRWILPFLTRWVQRRQRNLVLLSMMILFGFGGLSEYTGLGAVVGAITAGMLMRPVFNRMDVIGEGVHQNIQSFSYGFFGLIFFLWVGLSVDIGGMMREPALAILLFLAAFLGKFIGVYCMVPMKKITVREALTIGIGINARLTTEIIVAKLLLEAQLIDVHLFTALVAASSLSTIIVPFLFTIIVRLWGEELRATGINSIEKGGNHGA